MSEVSKPTKRLKAKPLFNEADYRKNFYNMVLDTQDLFTQLPNDLQTLVQTEDISKDQTIKQIKRVLKERLSSEIRLRLQNSENHSDLDVDTYFEAREKDFENAFKLLREFVDFLDDPSKTEIRKHYTDLLFDSQQMRKKLHYYIGELYYLLNNSSNAEELRTYYDISYTKLFSLLQYEDPGTVKSEKPLLDCISFNKALYGDNGRIDDVKKFLKRTGEHPAKWGGPEMHILLEKLEKAPLQKLKEAVREEWKVKMLVLTKNEIDLQVDNTLEDMRGEIESVISKHMEDIKNSSLRKTPENKEKILEKTKTKKFMEICKFDKSKVDAYMSVTSIADYETFMGEYVNDVESLMKGGDVEEDMIRKIIAQVELSSSVRHSIARQDYWSLFSRSSVLERLTRFQEEDHNFVPIRILGNVFFRNINAYVIEKMRIVFLWDDELSKIINKCKDEEGHNKSSLLEGSKSIDLLENQMLLAMPNDHIYIIGERCESWKAEETWKLDDSDSRFKECVTDFLKFVQLFLHPMSDEGPSSEEIAYQQIVALVTCLAFESSDHRQKTEIKLEVDGFKKLIERFKSLKAEYLDNPNESCMKYLQSRESTDKEPKNNEKNGKRTKSNPYPTDVETKGENEEEKFNQGDHEEKKSSILIMRDYSQRCAYSCADSNFILLGDPLSRFKNLQNLKELRIWRLLGVD